MSSFSEFIHMGGYGAFVWSAYGIWAAVMIWIALSARMRHREVKRRLVSRFKAEDLAR